MTDYDYDNITWIDLCTHVFFQPFITKYIQKVSAAQNQHAISFIIIDC